MRIVIEIGISTSCFCAWLKIRSQVIDVSIPTETYGCLVGGLEHEFYFSIYYNHPN